MVEDLSVRVQKRTCMKSTHALARRSFVFDLGKYTPCLECCCLTLDANSGRRLKSGAARRRSLRVIVMRACVFLFPDTTYVKGLRLLDIDEEAISSSVPNASI